MAKGRVDGNSDMIMIKITVIGTLRSMPEMPQITPQMANVRNTTSGLMFNVSPINFGSTKLPTTNCIAPTIARTKKPGVNSPN